MAFWDLAWLSQALTDIRLLATEFEQTIYTVGRSVLAVIVISKLIRDSL